MTLRNEKVRKALMREISDVILKDIKNPNIQGRISITDVEVSHDNSFAKVFFSVFGDEKIKNEAKDALEKFVPHIRYEIGQRIRLRLTPELRFYEDDSLERGQKVTELIDKISKGEI